MAEHRPVGSSESNFAYVISGLTVLSDLELPSAIADGNVPVEPEVRIHRGEVPHELESPHRTGLDWQAREGEFLLRITGVAQMLIRAGREILYAPEPGYDPGDLTLYLLGTCFAAVLQQRGCLVLHASAVAVGDHAVLFCGPSGAGKSTLAAMLCQRGYPLLNDDVCSLTPAGSQYTVCPDGRMLKLWAASVDNLELQQQRGQAVRSDTEKFYTAPPLTDVSARPVGAILLLATGDTPTAGLERLTLTESMAALEENAYRPTLVRAMQQGDTFFAASAALQRTAGVYRLTRPLNFALAEETLTLLESHWAEWGYLDSVQSVGALSMQQQGATR